MTMTTILKSLNMNIAFFGDDFGAISDDFLLAIIVRFGFVKGLVDQLIDTSSMFQPSSHSYQ